MSSKTTQTINGKMQYLKQQGLSGAFFWELGGDTVDGELIKAIGNGLNQPQLNAAKEEASILAV